ncbi:hypothetical protein [Bradyrhizobium neotropicale]|uniref:hypothetical protein n=1 Tax=Bradyrhizobium neotropicale TaxID=1497615 RepID=UPI001AD772F2|nr:hypothetical protein [Bradyrhizobium neotropicale]MBO4228420.1 hypothetical protein [Bradyrhizobium neotropicale]
MIEAHLGHFADGMQGSTERNARSRSRAFYAIELQEYRFFVSASGDIAETVAEHSICLMATRS